MLGDLLGADVHPPFFPRARLAAGWRLFARADYPWHDRRTQNSVDTITVDADPFTGADFGEARPIRNPGAVQQSYRKLNLSLGLDAQDWSVRMFVDNVTNERPILSLSKVASGGLLISADATRPRTIGLTATKWLSL